MKKSQVIVFIAGMSMLLFVSWGDAGHKVIAHVAESYLSAGTKDSIKYYLGDESFEDASVWADKILTDPVYKNTAAWHYIELPPGLKNGYPNTILKSMESKFSDNGNMLPDIFHAIAYEKYVVKDKKSTKQQKAIAVRFLINLVADAGEPMYICRAWNRDGNSLQPVVDDKYRKLQAEREDSLLKTEGITYTEIATKINASLLHHTRGASGNEVYSLMESYQNGEKLYDLAKKNHHSLADYYKEETVASVNENIYDSGIRLAIFFNELFAPPYVPGTSVHYSEGNTVSYTPAYKAAKYFLKISLKDAGEFIGTDVSLTGKVCGVSVVDHATELYLGAQYPDQHLTVVFRYSKYRYPATAITLLDKSITVNGTIVINNCRLEIVVDDAEVIENQSSGIKSEK